MKFFFITYGNNLIGYYSIIEARSYADARKIAFEGTDGGKFAFFYEGEEELSRQLHMGYLKGEIPLQAMRV